MAVTIQQIADLAGVSRGTVDRALNNRGRIRPEVAEKIKEIAKELGYQPNMAAKALSTANHALQIGVIIQYAETPFMKAVLEGTESARTGFCGTYPRRGCKETAQDNEGFQGSRGKRNRTCSDR